MPGDEETVDWEAELQGIGVPAESQTPRAPRRTPRRQPVTSHWEAEMQTLEGATETTADYLRGTSEWRGEEYAAIQAHDVANAEANRGTPHPSRSELYQQWRSAGQARLRTLTERFGQDAMVLGHLLFKIPPLAIRIRKSNITYRWKPLRTKESIAVKSGSGEAWIEVDLAFVGLNQINTSLGGLITLWKKSPICFIENLYIRENMLPENDVDSMAVRLENLVIDVAAGTPDAVWVTAMMCWFNWKPFSQNFWFRETWEATEDQQTEGGNSGTATTTSTEERASANSIVDLSVLETPGIVSSSNPMEARLSHVVQINDPGDPLVRPTQPVVYPFNSQPFMDYMSSGPDVAPPISEWTDNVTMNWKSLKRLLVPQQWQWDLNHPPEVPASVLVSAPPTSSPQASPVAVTGPRDIVIFMGDSIMKGICGSGHENLTFGGSNPTYDPNTDYLKSGCSNIPPHPRFTYYSLALSGIGSANLKRAWNKSKTNSALKVSGGANLSRVAGVVILCGLNDGNNYPTALNSLIDIMQDVSSAGAIPILLPLPPEGDSLNATPHIYSGLRSTGASTAWRETGTNTWLANVNSYHQSAITRVQNEVPNGWGPGRAETDYHADACEVGTSRTDRSLPLKRDYMTTPTTHWSDPTGAGRQFYNYHPKAQANTRLAAWIEHRLPWNAFSGQNDTSSPASNAYTVTDIEDGDTITVRQGAGAEIKLRLKNIDTPETYGARPSYNMSLGTGAYSNADVLRWMPHAQDSWRPADQQWGAKAKAKLVELTGGVNATIRVEQHGNDYYGRKLATIFKGDVNINLRLVELGLAWASTGGTDGTQGGPYEIAMAEAGGPVPDADPRRPKVGMWASPTAVLSGYPSDIPTTIRSVLERMQFPKDFRRDYPSGEDTWRAEPAGD